jgi:class 3 adenylate cyclase
MVSGNVVNAAARIEVLNKEFGTTILVTEATIVGARAGFNVADGARETMRGRSKLTMLFVVTVPVSVP